MSSKHAREEKVADFLLRLAEYFASPKDALHNGNTKNGLREAAAMIVNLRTALEDAERERDEALRAERSLKAMLASAANERDRLQRILKTQDAALKDAERANVLLRDQLNKEMAQTEAVERERDELRDGAVEAIQESERLHALNRDIERENERLRRALAWIGSSEGEDDAYALAEYARETLNQGETSLPERLR